MEKRRLGHSDLYPTKLGLGCMSLGTDEKRARSIIETALELGINYFDTADLYDYGVNETIVGKALKPVRDKVIIATKVGNRWQEGKAGWYWDPSKKYIKEAVKQSLRRLGTDYIDLYQLHGGTMDDPIDETIEAFEELADEGVIRYYGISSIRPTVIREYLRKSRIVSVMMQYSILDRRPEEQAIPMLKEKGVSLIVRGALAKGLLTDRYAEKLSQAKESGYLDYSYPELEKLLPELQRKLGENRSFTAASLHFVWANPVTGTAVVGASSPEQLRENVKAAEEPPLTEEEYAFIRKRTKANIYGLHRIES
ncbi:aldo/keto reductase [Caldibacillus debilis]|jgi:aryl-alcohol dehydrogenase-like predicted oxidoreductase|uniref:Putative oxidoreductase n=1 Tax=Caldibacillus debilis GB1 TaxID=1339248 RepID=A0A420VF92_9BACI|nr:aldo/keto reductase [Caldibacillus debilis]RKO62073.1 putative oxidoreductase [Caldibacillus debilis GB1]